MLAFHDVIAVGEVVVIGLLARVASRTKSDLDDVLLLERRLEIRRDGQMAGLSLALREHLVGDEADEIVALMLASLLRLKLVEKADVLVEGTRVSSAAVAEHASSGLPRRQPKKIRPTSRQA